MALRSNLESLILLTYFIRFIDLTYFPHLTLFHGATPKKLAFTIWNLKTHQGPDEIYRFLEVMTDGQAKSTRRLRFAQFKAFCNFLIEKADLNMRNPCDVPILAKAFKAPKQVTRRILDRETVEELIYNVFSLP